MITCDNRNCLHEPGSRVESYEVLIRNRRDTLPLHENFIDLCKNCRNGLNHKIGFLLDVMQGQREESDVEIFK